MQAWNLTDIENLAEPIEVTTSRRGETGAYEHRVGYRALVDVHGRRSGPSRFWRWHEDTYLDQLSRKHPAANLRAQAAITTRSYEHSLDCEPASESDDGWGYTPDPAADASTIRVRLRGQPAFAAVEALDDETSASSQTSTPASATKVRRRRGGEGEACVQQEGGCAECSSAAEEEAAAQQPGASLPSGGVGRPPPFDDVRLRLRGERDATTSRLARDAPLGRLKAVAPVAPCGGGEAGPPRRRSGRATLTLEPLAREALSLASRRYGREVLGRPVEVWWADERRWRAQPHAPK
ncbi:hypothetical protein EMIHUDRAFT_218815 [Emiliania huxleyi CCMP1516]|uniref:Uncharacterized protein n=2 Tax=Emiliania huxleyi TaxID=2903 RepID=A0A0D3I674_EMIH1|nr:hypothetical protein EMIHUDRAFT_218815 [Emiliania huxleyi CCMP1516]EOD06759.1 hypothetical protein EMIHUDRAFT_218815 [Emiliania huxleyi CCMP1516]|eukprot:XP_005759188.1 hypothetical protein EMIHUDRAFT_218815 [Emiliania huxleyi CCMP1516]